MRSLTLIGLGWVILSLVVPLAMSQSSAAPNTSEQEKARKAADAFMHDLTLNRTSDANLVDSTLARCGRPIDQIESMGPPVITETVIDGKNKSTGFIFLYSANTTQKAIRRFDVQVVENGNSFYVSGFGCRMLRGDPKPLGQ